MEWWRDDGGKHELLEGVVDKGPIKKKKKNSVLEGVVLGELVEKVLLTLGDCPSLAEAGAGELCARAKCCHCRAAGQH